MLPPRTCAPWRLRRPHGGARFRHPLWHADTDRRVHRFSLSTSPTRPEAAQWSRRRPEWTRRPRRPRRDPATACPQHQRDQGSGCPMGAKPSRPQPVRWRSAVAVVAHDSPPWREMPAPEVAGAARRAGRVDQNRSAQDRSLSFSRSSRFLVLQKACRVPAGRNNLPPPFSHASGAPLHRVRCRPARAARPADRAATAWSKAAAADRRSSRRPASR